VTDARSYGADEGRESMRHRCRLCGKTAREIDGYLERVNEKGIPGVWECRPSCDAQLSPDDRIIAAIEGEDKD
jgi:hypothetical protein